MKITKDNFVKFIIKIGIFLTLIAQMPLLRTVLGIDTKIIAYPVWAVIMCVTFFPKIHHHKNELIFVKLFISIFLVSLFLMQIFTDNEYFHFGGGDNFIIPLILSTVMLLVGYCNARLFDNEFLEDLAKIYIFATVLLCIDVYFEYLRGTSLLTVTYAFSAKNSVGQMILTAVVLLLYFYKPKGIKIVIKYGLLIFFLVIIILMRSRASIASLAIIPILYVFSSRIKLSYRLLISGCIAGIALFVLLNQEVYDLLIRNVLFNTIGDKSITFSDLNKITSNRFEYIELFRDVFPGNELTGVGFMYIDNMFMSALLNYGIIIGMLVILFAFYPVVIVFFKKRFEFKCKFGIENYSFCIFY